MTARSFLFVPGDRPERFSKAVASGADALILDLEDSVALAKKPFARTSIAAWLRSEPTVPCFVRINPLDGGEAQADLDSVLSAQPQGIMLPKAEGAASIRRLLDLMGGVTLPILPIASETPAAVFELGSYRQVAKSLAGLTWGAEDLPAAIGASAARNVDGSYTPPYEVVRALTLFGAHSAGVPAIETVFPDFADSAGLAAYVARGRRDGFTGMMAIHPIQVPIINSGFTPSAAEIAQAQAIVDVFQANPGSGALKLDGKMIDKPHLDRAKRLLALLD